jgi:hypothetical protein
MSKEAKACFVLPVILHLREVVAHFLLHESFRKHFTYRRKSYSEYLFSPSDTSACLSSVVHQFARSSSGTVSVSN